MRAHPRAHCRFYGKIVSFSFGNRAQLPYNCERAMYKIPDEFRDLPEERDLFPQLGNNVDQRDVLLAAAPLMKQPEK